jgi:hypothetical protein
LQPGDRGLPLGWSIKRSGFRRDADAKHDA